MWTKFLIGQNLGYDRLIMKKFDFDDVEWVKGVVRMN